MSVEVFGVNEIRIRMWRADIDKNKTIWLDCKCEDGSTFNMTLRIKAEVFLQQMRSALSNMQSCIHSDTDLDFTVKD